MEQKVIRTLNVYYYGIMVLTLIAATVSYFLISKGHLLPLDRMSTAGKVVQYFVIMDALCTIPLGLYLCKRQCRKLCLLSDEEAKYTGYRRSATMRILLVGNSMVFGVFAFYWMAGYQSMLWIAAVSAIGWIFTKPTVRKLQLELEPKDPNQETY